MNKIALTLLILITIVSVCQAQQKNGGSMSLTVAQNATINAAQEEVDGVMKAVGAYIQAGLDGNSKTAQKGFSTWATMSYNENGRLITVPIQLLYNYFDEKKRPVTGEIAACDVAGDVATVRLESDFDGARFTDMFTLVKDGNDWKIVSEVYHVKK